MTTTRNTIRRTVRAALPSGFTLTELMVVISIVVLLMAIALPAFTGMVRDSEKSLADNQLRVAVGAGRDAAIRSSSGDGAAVFLFTPSGRVQVVPCVQIGTLDDEVMDGPVPTGRFRPRDVFVPVAEVEPLVMPRGWSVRAYAGPGAISRAGTQSTGWYENAQANVDLTTNWVFPESGFTRPTGNTDAAVRSRGWQRQSFMIRFKAGSGELDTSGREALVLDPLAVADSIYREASPWTGTTTLRVPLARQLAIDPARFVRTVLGSSGASGFTAPQQRDLLGDRSAETVLCRGVTELALYREDSLASAMGAASNRRTGTLYAPDADSATGPRIDPSVLTQSGAADDAQMLEQIGEWITGTFRRGGTAVASDARIYTIERNLGQIREIEASVAGEVSP